MSRTLSLVKKEKMSRAVPPPIATPDLVELFESTEDLIWSVDPDHRLIAFNKAASSYMEWILGAPAAAGALAYNPLRAEQASIWRDYYARALQEGTFRTEQRMPGGRWLELQFNPIVRLGRKAGVSVFSKDISLRKHALNGLSASEARLREAERIGLSGSSSWDVNSDVTTWSEGLYRITGRDPNLPAPSHAERKKLYTPESWVRLDAAVKRALASGKPYDLELQIERADGELRWVRARGEAIKDGKGRVRSLFGTLQDTTAQKDAEANLRDSEERYRATFEQAAVGMVHTSFDGRFLRCNPRFAQIVGYPIEELPGMTFQQITYPEDVAGGMNAIEQLREGKIDSFALEKRYLRKDGSITWGRITLSLQRDAAGKPAHLIAVVQDINARKSAEEAVRRAEQKFRDIFEDAPEGIFQTSVEGKSLALNPAGARILRYESVEQAMAAIADSGRVVWQNRAERAHYAKLLEENGTVRDFQCQFKRSDGTPIWISLTAKKICGPDGETLYYQGFYEDITEKKRLEDALRSNLREVKLLSEINSARLNARTERDLLREYCRVIVEIGGYRMAWVGFAEESEGKPIVPAAHYGHEAGYLKLLNLTWADAERGKGPTGRSIRTGKVHVAEDFMADPILTPWHAEAGKRGYRSSIALPLRLADGSMAALTAYGASSSVWSEAERKLMEQIALDLGFGITSLRNKIAKKQYQDDLRESLEQTIQVIAGTVDQRDPFTAGHQRRVADLSRRIGEKMGLSEERLRGLHLGASIHDVGKIGIPAELLSKPGRLSKTQFELIKEHVQLGYELIKDVHFPWPISDIVLQHHERLDGSGYPQGLKEDAIRQESKIVAVADVVEAMGSHRPYRAARGIDAALEEIQSKSGILYDAATVKACVQLFREEGYKFPD
jgi:PAS domain S-box-containing protein